MRSSKRGNRAHRALRIAGGIVVAFGVVSWLVLRLWPLPELAAFDQRRYSVRITDSTGRLLRVSPIDDGTRREFTRLDEIPPQVVRTFVGAEDRRFRYHPGVDLIAVSRAAVQNARAGAIVSGASTISMQLARIMIESTEGEREVAALRGNDESSRRGDGRFSAKIRETWTALRLERRLSKNRILELWLNNLPFGAGVEGVTSAARAFYGRPLVSLSRPEILSLAVVPRSPTVNHPHRGRRENVTASLALADRLGVAVTRPTMDRSLDAARRRVGDGSAVYPFRAPHFVRFVEGEVTDAEWRTGATIRTTIDLDAQSTLREALYARVSGAERHRIHNGAGLLIDPRDGAILAYVGSQNFFDEEHNGQIDGVRIVRQPGSTLKPFLYALALDSGFTAATILPDVPMSFGGEEIYVPQNFDRRFRGPVRLRVALAASLNIPAVYTLERIGVDRFVQTLVGLGFDTLDETRHHLGVGLAIGNAEIRLYELVEAFTVFPGDGVVTELVWRADERDGGGTHRVFSATSAGIVRDILTDTVARVPGFGTHRVLDTPFPAIFKTGTSNQFTNIWALGSSPTHAVGVWMGNFSGQTVVGAPGSSLPAAVAAEVLSALWQDDARFPGVAEAHRVRISPVSGMGWTEAVGGEAWELFPNGVEPPPDTWHTTLGGPVRYPPRYHQWAVGRGLPVAGTPEGVHQRPEIVHPLDGSLFYLDPTLPRDAQAIWVEAIGPPDRSMTLNLDGRTVTSGEGSIVYRVELNRGRHRLELHADGSAPATAEFEIR